MEYGAGSPLQCWKGDWVMRALYGQAFCSSRPKILVIMRIGPYKVGTREVGDWLFSCRFIAMNSECVYT